MQAEHAVLPEEVLPLRIKVLLERLHHCISITAFDKSCTIRCIYPANNFAVQFPGFFPDIIEVHVTKVHKFTRLTQKAHLAIAYADNFWRVPWD